MNSTERFVIDATARHARAIHGHMENGMSYGDALALEKSRSVAGPKVWRAVEELLAGVAGKATQKFPIGTQFVPHGRARRLCTVTDYLVTRNTAGEIVRTCYVATHEMMGQIVTDDDVCELTIARGINRLEAAA